MHLLLCSCDVSYKATTFSRVCHLPLTYGLVVHVSETLTIGFEAICRSSAFTVTSFLLLGVSINGTCRLTQQVNTTVEKARLTDSWSLFKTVGVVVARRSHLLCMVVVLKVVRFNALRICVTQGYGLGLVWHYALILRMLHR